MAGGGLFIIRGSATVATAVTIMQMQPGSARALVLHSLWVTQDGVNASQQFRLALLLKSVAATFGATQTPIKTDPHLGTANGTYHGTAAATAEGTDGTVYMQQGQNVLNGFYYEPTPERKIVFPASSIVAVKFMAAPVNATWSWEAYFDELG